MGAGELANQGRGGVTRLTVKDLPPGNLLDRLIRGISPQWAYNRAIWRERERLMDAFASYRHSVYNRMTRDRSGKSGTADAHLDYIERSNLIERSRDL